MAVSVLFTVALSVLLSAVHAQPRIATPAAFFMLCSIDMTRKLHTQASAKATEMAAAAAAAVAKSEDGRPPGAAQLAAGDGAAAASSAVEPAGGPDAKQQPPQKRLPWRPKDLQVLSDNFDLLNVRHGLQPFRYL